MLKATKTLYDALRAGKINPRRIQPLVYLIRRFGGTEDLDYHYPLCRENPGRLLLLIPIIASHGNIGHAEDLFDGYIRNNRLRYPDTEDILECLGDLRLQKSQGNLDVLCQRRGILRIG
jgi:hypothetical protein